MLSNVKSSIFYVKFREHFTTVLSGQKMPLNMTFFVIFYFTSMDQISLIMKLNK